MIHANDKTPKAHQIRNSKRIILTETSTFSESNKLIYSRAIDAHLDAECIS